MGSKDQPVLAKRGDDIRIDWGYLYVAAPTRPASADYTVAAGAVARADFADSGKLPATDPCQPRAAGDRTPVSAAGARLGQRGQAGRSPAG